MFCPPPISTALLLETCSSSSWRDCAEEKESITKFKNFCPIVSSLTNNDFLVFCIHSSAAAMSLLIAISSRKRGRLHSELGAKDSPEGGPTAFSLTEVPPSGSLEVDGNTFRILETDQKRLRSAE